MPKDIANLIPASNINSASLTGAYQVINTGGLPVPCYEVRITNASTTTVLISVDGINQHETVIPDGVLYLHAQNNSGPSNQKTYWPQGYTFYALGTPGIGFIYVTGNYNPN